jgi:hypothetical protein
MGHDRWASWAPTDPQEDRLKDGERAVCQRQKRADTDKQQGRVEEEEFKELNSGMLCALCSTEYLNAKVTFLRQGTQGPVDIHEKHKHPRAQ